MKYILSFAFICFALFLGAQKQDTIRMMHYNILKYGDVGCTPQSSKDGLLRTIFDAYRPDILTVNEMSDNAGIASTLRNNALTYNDAMMPTTFSNSNGSEIVNMLFYNEDKLGFLSHTAIKGNVRDIDVYRMYHKSGTAAIEDTLDFWCIVAHLKASTGYEADRAEAAKDVRTWLKNHPEVKRYMISGDFNLYGSDEEAWRILTGTASGGPFFNDPAGKLTGWDGSAFALFHTQSPSDGINNNCSVEGGMDDRFDFMLTAPLFSNAGEKITILPGSYRVFGNDGVSYNMALNCPQTTSVSGSVCTALKRASDHLPVIMSLLFPSVLADDEAPFSVTLLGNPVSTTTQVNIRIETSLAGTYLWDLIDVLGRRVAKSYFNITTIPTTETALTLPPLAHGTYFLRVRDENEKKIVKKVAVIR